MATATITNFGLQSGTDRTMYAIWSWDKSNTDTYKVAWDYYLDGIWFNGSHTNASEKQSTYSAPSNAILVRFRVIPISKTKTVKKKETHYWTADWTSYVQYSFSDSPPKTPPSPDVEIEDYKLTAILDNLDVNADSIQFQVVKDNTIIFNTSDTTIRFASDGSSTSDKTGGYARYSCYIDAGSEYKVRCRSVRGEFKSAWSEYTNNYTTKPATSSGIISCGAESDSSVLLEWNAVSNATSYDIEYSTKKEYFDESKETTTIDGIENPSFIITGLETGNEYFFRVRAVNGKGVSDWTEIVSISVGKVPAAPTTWSSTTTCIIGEPLTLNWVHNAEDGSSQRYAEVQLYLPGEENPQTYNIRTDEEEDDEKTMFFEVDTSTFTVGTKIEWRVRTAGVLPEYGDWSIQRTVDIYAPVTLTLNAKDRDGNLVETLTGFPLYITAVAGPKPQTPIGYHVSITANDSYDYVDSVGATKYINVGQVVYSKHFDISDDLTLELSAGHIDLQNNVNYTITCVVSMNSGLTAESTVKFGVSWTDKTYEPNAEIGIDDDTLTAIIRPYCEDDDGNLIEGITLSVYRREFDGTFTELATGLDNTIGTYITDPHPALDYARYRVVAVSDDTGSISYYDIPGYPVGESSIVIQWDEAWSSFNTYTEDDSSQPSWSGSMLKLPYNVDVSDNNTPDVSLINYIGRSHPVSYYGTQLGVSSTWNAAIEKDDEETIYALRRLAIWMGDVYVREPSGTGYWANIRVSFNQKHLELTIPVTLDITRVEGGA